MYFNVNLKLLTKLINSCFCWCVNYVDFKMHGATIKKKMCVSLRFYVKRLQAHFIFRRFRKLAKSDY